MTDNELLETMANIMKDAFIQDMAKTPKAGDSLRKYYEKYLKGESIRFMTNARRRETKEAKCDCGGRAARTTHASYCSFWR